MWILFLIIVHLQNNYTFISQSSNNARIEELEIAGNNKYVVAGDEKGNVYIWDIERGRIVRRFRGDGSITTMNITSDNKYVIADESELLIWDIESGELVRRFSGDGGIEAMEITRDSRYVVAGDGYGNVYIRDMTVVKNFV